jgi:hypothetical protein
VTTCTAVAGSRDSTTNGTNLCDGYKVDSPFGSTVASVLVAYQINDEDGTYCATNRYPATGFTITNVSKDVHHKMVYSAATIPVGTARGASDLSRQDLRDPSARQYELSNGSRDDPQSEHNNDCHPLVVL